MCRTSAVRQRRLYPGVKVDQTLSGVSQTFKQMVIGGGSTEVALERELHR